MGRIKYYLLFCTLYLTLSCAGQVSVSADLDSSRILLGDQLTLQLRASFPPGSRVSYPAITSETLGGLQVIREAKIDTLKTDPEVMTRQNITISAYDSGYYYIPELAFSFTLPNGQQQIAKTVNLLVEVATIEVDTTSQLAPIKGIIKEPFRFVDALPFIYLFGGLILVIGIGLFIYQKLIRKPEEEEEVIQKLPAHVIAFQKLDRLKTEKLWQQGEIKKYQSQLTYILREYLEKQFNVPARETTTDEILFAMREVPISGDWKIRLRELLQIADLVKFAKAEPGADFHASALEDAYNFVEESFKVHQEIKEAEEAEQADTEEPIKPGNEV